MAVVDVAAWIGAYPYRHLPDPSPTWLLRQMDRVGIDQAWVGYLPSLAYRDPATGTAELLRALASHPERLLPVPSIHPGLPRWEQDLNDAADLDAPAVRVYPTQLGLDPTGGEMRVLATASAAAGLPLLLTVRLEDPRQRHPLDRADELPAAAIRALARCDPQVRLIVSHADRAFIEEVHFGLTPDEARRIVWDIAWIWGPPEDHLALLLETVGWERFVLGTGMPLRIPDAPFAKLDLLDLPADQRRQILGGNLERWRGA
ncbi:MAG: amidohydrolase family protein [Gemmatimonadetes bacterium]|nr:amidohydrolase family protein [Gemmatimonadota bacterium]